MTDNLREEKNNTDQEDKVAEQKQEVSNEINTIVNQEIGKNKEKEDVIIEAEGIHVMPKRFLPQSQKKKLGNKQKLVLVVIAFVLFLIIVVGVMLWIADRSITKLPDNSGDNQENNQEVVVELTHDQKIVEDLQVLNSALRRYFSDFNTYPSSLSAISNYLDNPIPKNPDGLSYDYTVIDSGANFRILVEFDNSDSNNRLGVYKFTRLGISVYNPDEDNNSTPNVPVPPPPPDNNTTSTPPNIPPPPPPTSNNLDADNDQLTSSEESFFNTSSSDADSDNDGFKDGVEIMNLYNPLSSSGSLLDSGMISIYTSPNYQYSVFYPTSWIAQGLDEDSSEVVLLADSESGEYFSIQVFANTDNLSLTQWQEQLNIVGSWTGFSLGRSQKLTALATTDSQHVLYVNQSYAYVISYFTDNQGDKNFATTFMMMLNSFEITNG